MGRSLYIDFSVEISRSCWSCYISINQWLTSYLSTLCNGRGGWGKVRSRHKLCKCGANSRIRWRKRLATSHAVLFFLPCSAHISASPKLPATSDPSLLRPLLPRNCIGCLIRSWSAAKLCLQSHRRILALGLIEHAQAAVSQLPNLASTSEYLRLTTTNRLHYSVTQRGKLFVWLRIATSCDPFRTCEWWHYQMSLSTQTKNESLKVSIILKIIESH